MAKKRSDKSRSQLTLAEKATIKEEQAEFVEKINTAPLNEHQQVIVEAARRGTGRYVVLAGPGCGKTFTGVKASTSFTGSAIYFSYNKKIQIDTNLKLVAIDSRMVATTAHAFGLSCLIAYSRGKCKVDDKDEKYSSLIKQYIGTYWQLFIQSIKEEIEDEEANVEVMRLDAFTWSKMLVHYAQVSLTPATPKGLASLVEDFDLVDIKTRSLTWPFVVQAVAFAIEEGTQQFLGPQHVVSFDDMIYYPNVIPGVPVRQYDHVLVDEAQDTSRASLELMMKACHADTQVFFIGDRRQSIYLFAGASYDSIDQIIGRLDAQTLPLRICYRCGSRIVELANQLGGELVSAGHHEGKVEVVPDYLDRLQPGDAVLSRTTANLIRGCLKTLQKGKKAKVLGKNIGDNIGVIVTRLEAMRIRRGVAALFPDLSNFLDLLEEYHRGEAKSLEESRKNPELALSELEDKVETVKAFFEAYVSKCNTEGLRVADDPKCAFDKSSGDFKTYIYGLFSEDDGAKDFVLFMTAHRSKGGEWENVFIIGCDEFPHPKAKSDRQKQQEENLMYVAVTRAIENLYFVGKPFGCLSVPGYEPAEPLTIISFAAADHLEVHPSIERETVPLLDGVERDYGKEVVLLGGETVSQFDSETVKQVHTPEMIALLQQYSELLGQDLTGALVYGTPLRPTSALFRGLEHAVHMHTDRARTGYYTYVAVAQLLEKSIVDHYDLDFVSRPATVTLLDGETVLLSNSVKVIEEPAGNVVEALEAGKISRVLAIEVLCPACNGACVDPATGATSITDDLVGHSVVCSACRKACIVPLNAFSLRGDVVAREKPVGVTNTKREKRGRTQKERKAKSGRKTKGKGVRQPMQLSLDLRVINTLNAMGVNKSELFEELLQQYEPFLDAWSELGNDDFTDEDDELDHDEIEA